MNRGSSNRSTIERGRSSKVCSFCKKRQHEVGMLVSGPNGLFICDECVSRLQLDSHALVYEQGICDGSVCEGSTVF